MTALPTSGRSSENLLKGSTPQSVDHARYASPAFTGFQRDQEKQKEQGQKALWGQLAGAGCDLFPQVQSPLRKAALRVKPVFSPARAAEEGPLYISGRAFCH